MTVFYAVHAGRFTPRRLDVLYRNVKDIPSGKLTFSFLPVQKLEDGFNFNVFAIGYVAKIF